MIKMDKITAGIIIAMVLGFTVVGLTNVEPTHYCEIREIKAYCVSLSSTNGTCYTLPENTGGKRCSSLWREIPTIFDEPEVSRVIPTGTRQYLCSSNGCVMIK